MFDAEQAPSRQKNGPDNGFSLFNGDSCQFPVLIGVPHAGRVYPAEIHDNLAVPATKLLRLEDRYADRLATRAISSGFTAIIAQKPRAWVDLNRSRTEIDPEMVTGLKRSQFPEPSRKVRGGLGMIPRRLTGVGNLWRNKWSEESVDQRVRSFHEPYHQQISTTLSEMRAKFGGAILLDLHSMPPLDDDGEKPIDIVLGDLFGRSSGSRFSDLAMSFFRESGLRAQLNHPYAGGYILERHGEPGNAVHALQLEVDRRCYLDSELREPGDKLSEVAVRVEQLAGLLADQMGNHFQLAAAE